MYPVSNAFLEAVKANNRKYYWTGRITTTAGTVYNFDQDDMVKGSGYITSQCCGSTEIELGTVYAAEMGISLFKCLEIKAYDYMVRFEKAFISLESIGNAYDFMVLCSTACEVTLAQDRATIEAMPNGTENLSIYSDNDIETSANICDKLQLSDLWRSTLILRRYPYGIWMDQYIRCSDRDPDDDTEYHLCSQKQRREESLHESVYECDRADWKICLHHFDVDASFGLEVWLFRRI